MIEQEPFEFADVFEGAAIGEGAGGVYRQPVVESERLTRKADAGFRLRTLGEGAIAVTPAAHHIEAFEGESRRIDLTVAGSACGIGAVAVELLADGDRASDIRLKCGHARGRGGVEAEDALHDPDAAQNGRRCSPIRGHLENARLSQDSAADGVFRERDLAHRDSADAGDAIVFRQTFVEEGEVGIDDGARREVAVEEFLDEETGFFDGGELERVVEFVVVIEGAGRGAVVDLAEVEPVVGQSVDEAAGLRVVEQAIRLGF